MMNPVVMSTTLKLTLPCQRSLNWHYIGMKKYKLNITCSNHKKSRKPYISRLTTFSEFFNSNSFNSLSVLGGMSSGPLNAVI